MNFDGLKRLSGQWVNLWPQPLVMPRQWRARMQWRVACVKKKDAVVELHAPSGHFFNAADVIHHYQQQGQCLVLNAQVVIDGNEVRLEPRPWNTAPQVVAPGWCPAKAAARPQGEPNWRPVLALGLGFMLGCAFSR